MWVTCKDDHDPQVSSFKEFLSIEATFILEASTSLAKNLVRNEDVFILLLRAQACLKGKVMALGGGAKI